MLLPLGTGKVNNLIKVTHQKPQTNTILCAEAFKCSHIIQGCDKPTHRPS